MPANKDAKKHILETTFDYGMVNINHHDPKLSKRDHRKGYQMYQLEKQVDKIDASKIKLDRKWEMYQKRREEKGLYCCRKMNLKTQDRCICVFSSSLSRKKHEDGNGSQCSFPPTDLATQMHLLHLDGNLAFCLATGAMTNRCDATDMKGMKIRDGNQEIEEEDWFKRGCYNSVRRTKKRATKALVTDLEYLFLAGLQRGNLQKGGASKYTPLEALTYLLNLKTPDGRRKYSFAKDNKNGPPPSVKYLKTWFSNRAKKETEKNEDEGIATGTNKEINYDNLSLAKLKKMNRSRLKIKKITRKKIMLVLLDTYNILEGFPEHSRNLTDESIGNLEAKCKELRLPFDIDKVETFRKLLELRDEVDKMMLSSTSSEDKSTVFDQDNEDV